MMKKVLVLLLISSNFVFADFADVYNKLQDLYIQVMNDGSAYTNVLLNSNDYEAKQDAFVLLIKQIDQAEDEVNKIQSNESEAKLKELYVRLFEDYKDVVIK